jgi:hypothetical protein
VNPLQRLLAPGVVRRASFAVIVIVGAVWLVVRFVGLNTAPHGPWLDETWDAVQAMCLAENGHDADGQFWPLISNSQGGGSLPITWTATMVAWTRVFGTSLAGFRSLSALWISLSCACVFATARGLVRLVPASQQRAGFTHDVFPWLACVAGLVSPWSFQLSRIAMEQPLAPFFLILAVLAMVNFAGQGNVFWALLCGISGAASMITYPPLRLAVPCILALGGVALFLSKTRGSERSRFARGLVVSAFALIAAFAPVIIRLASGQDRKRMLYVSIFSPDWLNANRGDIGEARFFVLTFLDNLWLHLRPSYLFGTGDPNLRHSSHLIGQLSPVDILAVLLACAGVGLVLLFGFRQMSLSSTPRWSRLEAREQVLAICAVFSIFAGMFATFPTALTWEGLPHALRSVGAWPFVALFSGAVLAIGWARLRWLPAVTAAVALAYTAYFLPGYFRLYRHVDSGVFFRDLAGAVEAGSHKHPPRSIIRTLRPFAKRYGPEVLRYYLMHDGKLTCDQSQKVYEYLHGLDP